MDLEKGMERRPSVLLTLDQIPTMAGGISDLRVIVPAVIDGGVTAANMKPTGKKKSLMCWLVVAGSVIFLTNYIQAAPKYQLIPLETIMVIFTMLMCAIFLVFRTMKQM